MPSVRPKFGHLITVMSPLQVTTPRLGPAGVLDECRDGEIFTEAFDGPLQNLTLPSYPAQNGTGSVGQL